jgi:tight adherence protein C
MEFSFKELDQKLRAWNTRRKRFPAIAAGLPEAIDMLALVMRAGLDFQVALKQYVDRGPAGPLKEELRTVHEEIQLGTSRVEALKHFAQRVPEPSIKEMVRTIIQGIELGSSLTPLLRSQAQALRRQRAYQAEKKAAQAPLKLLFPLMVFIFPTIFIVLFGPLALSFFSGAKP